MILLVEIMITLIKFWVLIRKFIYSLFIPCILFSQTPQDTELWGPVPKKINSVNFTTPPSDAIILFDGKDLKNWSQRWSKEKSNWKIADDGSMFSENSGEGIQTIENFGSVQFHIEWKTSSEIDMESDRDEDGILDLEDLCPDQFGLKRFWGCSELKYKDRSQYQSNSGVFFHNLYEVQILNSFDNETYVNGMAGSVYKQHIPLVNASRANDQWQSYDIVFVSPKFDEYGKKFREGSITVFHNGILIHNSVKILGSTENVGPPKNIVHGDGPIAIQEHCCTKVSFRNIWVREIE